jgi:hypothetical protein
MFLCINQVPEYFRSEGCIKNWTLLCKRSYKSCRWYPKPAFHILIFIFMAAYC